MPLVAEGLAAVVWRGQGSLDERRDAVESALAANRLVLGIPVDCLGPLADAVKAGDAWRLARLIAGPPGARTAANAYAWAMCSFLMAQRQPGRDLLAAATTTASPDPLAASAQAREQAWQAFLAQVVVGTAPPH